MDVASVTLFILLASMMVSECATKFQQPNDCQKKPIGAPMGFLAIPVAAFSH